MLEYFRLRLKTDRLCLGRTQVNPVLRRQYVHVDPIYVPILLRCACRGIALGASHCILEHWGRYSCATCPWAHEEAACAASRHVDPQTGRSSLLVVRHRSPLTNCLRGYALIHVHCRSDRQHQRKSGSMEVGRKVASARRGWASSMSSW